MLRDLFTDMMEYLGNDDDDGNVKKDDNDSNAATSIFNSRIPRPPIAGFKSSTGSKSNDEIADNSSKILAQPSRRLSFLKQPTPITFNKSDIIDKGLDNQKNHPGISFIRKMPNERKGSKFSNDVPMDSNNGIAEIKELNECAEQCQNDSKFDVSKNSSPLLKYKFNSDRKAMINLTFTVKDEDSFILKEGIVIKQKD